jgi:hypothetical protein
MLDVKLGFDVSTLTEYVKQDTSLISRAVLGGDTVRLIPNIYKNVPYKQRINQLSTDGLIQARVSCEVPTSSGTTSLLEKDICVVPLGVYENIDATNLKQFVWGLQQRPGYNQDIPFESYYITQKVLNIQNQIDKMIWGSQAKSSSAFEGLKHMFDNDTDVKTVSFDITNTGKTFSDWNSAIMSMLSKFDEAYQYRDDVVLFIPTKYYDRLINLAFMSNMIHVPPTKGQLWEYPGTPTSLKIKATPNITGNYMALGTLSNMHFATDLFGEETQASVKEIDYIRCKRFEADFTAGVAYGYGDLWVIAE